MRVGVFVRIFAAVLLLSGTIILLCSSAACEEISPKDKIYSALLSSESQIDLSEFGLDKTELISLMREIRLQSPELFYVSDKITYSHNKDGQILTLTPSYTARGDELDKQLKFYSDTIKNLLVDLKKSASEGERALYIHDTLAAKFDYDTKEKNYDVYSLFADGRGVCQAYSLAFVALAGEVGLESKIITSDDMDHAWNIVQVDGEWYHVDVTRDDPISDTSPSETVLHQAFLRSDESMRTIGYYGYESTAVCDSKRFETEGAGFLEEIKSPFAFNEYGCFITSADGIEYRLDLTEAPLLLPIPNGDIDGNGVADARDLNIALTSPDFEEIRSIILSNIMKKAYLEEILRIRSSRE